MQDLDNWFKGALEGRLTKDARTPRCCCISGPPGCGRSTTVKLLAKVRLGLNCMGLQLSILPLRNLSLIHI